MKKKLLVETVEALVRTVTSHVDSSSEYVHYNTRSSRARWGDPLVPQTWVEAWFKFVKFEKECKIRSRFQSEFEVKANAEITALKARVKELSLAVCRMSKKIGEPTYAHQAGDVITIVNKQGP